jgi:nucleotide-binding universal stress UspA family protein
MRVLFAADGSSDALSAAEFLGQLPLTRDSRVRIVTVIEPGRSSEEAPVAAGSESVRATAHMPKLELTAEEIESLAAYLTSLR